jgi:hypothetical protein
MHPLPLQTIGRVETVSLPEVGMMQLHARVDTGAQTSSIWASSVVFKNNQLHVIFLGPEHPAYTGKEYIFTAFSDGMVASSNGQAEHRYKIRTLITVSGRRIRARLTLADRSTQVYPMLIGRNVLRGKFIVDVKKGTPIRVAEQQRSTKLQAKHKKGND